MGFRAYYNLTKPGIIYGNLVTATAGFLLAAKGHPHWWLLIATLVGISLVIASACVFNNVVDRDIDKLMARTARRATASGLISSRAALTYASVLGVLGFVVLGLWTNPLVLAIGATAFIFYVVLYGLAKRRSVHGTLVGSIPGAAPPVAGYCAVTNHLDGGALILFLILVFWQMPHFYAIAIYRARDYRAAHLPVLPVKKGFLITKLQILLYIIAYILAASALTIYDYAGRAYLLVTLVVGLAWLYLGVKGFRAGDDERWARRMFFFSLIVTLSWSAAVAANSLLVKL
jgi:protoheme IX farnesyltransferase